MLMYPKHALRICSLIFLLLTSIFSWSQTTISGNIVDTDGFSLIGANISIVGTSEGGIADIDGNFSLTTSKNLPFTIEVSYTGYANQVIEVTDNSPLMIVLSEGLLIDEVVVSASRKREKVQEAPASISVINSKKLESSAQAVDPIRNLISTAGVQLQQQSAARINISMRGSSGLFGTSVVDELSNL